MSTPQERRDEAAQEAREHPDCIGCRLGIRHDREAADDFTQWEQEVEA